MEGEIRGCAGRHPETTTKATREYISEEETKEKQQTEKGSEEGPSDSRLLRKFYQKKSL